MDIEIFFFVILSIITCQNVGVSNSCAEPIN